PAFGFRRRTWLAKLVERAKFRESVEAEPRESSRRQASPMSFSGAPHAVDAVENGSHDPARGPELARATVMMS
ncbi:MAG TPA: hypothetical protein VM580_29665, partial [Labilithrix sp.]|nr:hypothetical protein [Labilithrix sp.]